MATIQVTSLPFVCKQCNSRFGGRQRKFCSARCRQLNEISRVKGAGEERTCKNCGIVFRSRKYDSNQVVCSFFCRPPKATIECQRCGKIVEKYPTGKGAKLVFCSRECQFKREEKPIVVIDDRPFKCKWCGLYYIAEAEQTTCGSGECQRLRGNAYAYENMPIVAPSIIKECAACCCFFLANKKDKTCSRQCKRQHKINQKRESKTRRIFRMNGCDTEIYSRVSVFKRDGWKCGICGKPVKRKRRFPDPLSASIDHIIPLAKGGADAEWNVQCAHLRCNEKKGDAVDVLF